MIVPRGFLQYEVRDGFYVSSKMKRTWAATIEVFEAVKMVCRKYDIKYYAEWGTLLGAVRHGGFVPWDDDFDICMKRDDYMRFIKVAADELPMDYALLNIHNEHEYNHLMTRVVNRKQISFEIEYMDAFHGFPYIVGVDIFPLDYLPDNEEERKKQLADISKAGNLASLYTHESKTFGENRKEVISLAHEYDYQIVEGKYIRQQIFFLIEEIMSKYNAEDGCKLVSIPLVLTYGTKGIPASYYDKTVRVPFEYTDIEVPLLYDDMLERKYSNYIVPVRNWDTHMYPVYLDLEKTVHDVGRTDVWADYTADIAKKDFDTYLRSCDRTILKNSTNEVVFMPYRADSWSYMEPIWNAMQEDESIVCILMPIPYYEKDNEGKLSILHFDKQIFDQFYETVDFGNYDFIGRRPSAIVIQNPYDEYDVSISVAPPFYSRVLKQYTDNLILVPEFCLDEYCEKDERAIYNMNFFCTTPGVIFADTVYVQSSNMRERYIEKLTSFLGKSTVSEWKRKIKVATWEMSNSESLGIDENDIPKEWWDKLLDEEGNGKKTLLYYTNISKLYELQKEYLKKINSNLDLFAKLSDRMTIIWYIDSFVYQLVKEEAEGIYMEFLKLTEDVASKKNIIIDSEHEAEVLAICDAFYGDRGKILNRFSRTGRPLMIQDV